MEESVPVLVSPVVVVLALLVQVCTEIGESMDGLCVACVEVGKDGTGGGDGEALLLVLLEPVEWVMGRDA